MDTGSELLSLNDSLQERREPLTIGRAHVSRQLLFVLGGDPAREGEQITALAGQIQSADPAVTRIGTTFDQTAPLQLIDQRDHAARRHLYRVADRGLRLTLAEIDDVEDSKQGRFQADRRDPLRESPSGIDADLGKQEGERDRGHVTRDALFVHDKLNRSTGGAGAPRLKEGSFGEDISAGSLRFIFAINHFRLNLLSKEAL